MKKIIKLFILLFLVVSCSNEENSKLDEQNDLLKEQVFFDLTDGLVEVFKTNEFSSFFDPNFFELANKSNLTEIEQSQLELLRQEGLVKVEENFSEKALIALNRLSEFKFTEKEYSEYSMKYLSIDVTNANTYKRDVHPGCTRSASLYTSCQPCFFSGLCCAAAIAGMYVHC